MRLLPFFTFAVPAFAAALGAAAARSEDLSQLYARVGESVVLIETFDGLGGKLGQGTGFVVQGGLVVTNHHVVEGAGRVEVVSKHEVRHPVLGLLGDDVEQDLAILKIGPHHLPALAFLDRPPTTGQPIVVIGNPLGLSLSLSQGIVSAVREHGLKGIGDASSAPLVQITAPMSPGSSGSPVLDLEGRVLGVAVSQLVDGQNLNFAIPISSVSALLSASRNARVRAAFAPAPANPALRNLAISVAILAAVVYAVTRLGGSGGSRGDRSSSSARHTRW